MSLQRQKLTLTNPETFFFDNQRLIQISGQKCGCEKFQKSALSEVQAVVQTNGTCTINRKSVKIGQKRQIRQFSFEVKITILIIFLSMFLTFFA